MTPTPGIKKQVYANNAPTNQQGLKSNQVAAIKEKQAKPNLFKVLTSPKIK